jgi:hypothetical protein
VGKLYHGTAGSAASTPIAHVVNINDNEAEVGEVEITTRDSLSGGRPIKEFVPGEIDEGSVEAVIAYLKTRYTTLLGFKGVLKSWRIEFADGSRSDFDGFLTSIGMETERENMMVIPITIRVAGAKTFTEGAS